MNENIPAHADQCPRCGAGSLRTWAQLDHEQREVARRLPDSARHTAQERERSRRWCVRCWHEETSHTPRDA